MATGTRVVVSTRIDTALTQKHRKRLEAIVFFQISSETRNSSYNHGRCNDSRLSSLGSDGEDICSHCYYCYDWPTRLNPTSKVSSSREKNTVIFGDIVWTLIIALRVRVLENTLYSWYCRFLLRFNCNHVVQFISCLNCVYIASMDFLVHLRRRAEYIFSVLPSSICSHGVSIIISITKIILPMDLLSLNDIWFTPWVKLLVSRESLYGN